MPGTKCLKGLLIRNKLEGGGGAGGEGEGIRETFDFTCHSDGVEPPNHKCLSGKKSQKTQDQECSRTRKYFSEMTRGMLCASLVRNKSQLDPLIQNPNVIVKLRSRGSDRHTFQSGVFWLVLSDLDK